MFTQFANVQVLAQLDIMSKLIWASKTVRLSLRKTPKGQ